MHLPFGLKSTCKPRMISNSGNEISDLFTWRSMVTERRNAVADSDNGSSEHEKDMLLGLGLGDVHDQTSFCKNCCSCKTTRRSRVKSRSNSLLTTRSESKGTHKAASYREQLEMKVLNDEIYAQGLSEKQGNVSEQVDIITEILKTLSMYAHCLEIRHRTGIRLQQLINKIVPSKENNSNERDRWESILKKLREIFQTCTENSDLPDAFYENLEEHKDKHRDFNKASSNFCHVLQQEHNLPNSQLRKLELQYEEIKLTYSESIALIGTQLSELIDTKAVVAERCLQNIAPVLQYTIEEEKAMWYLLKELTLANISHVTQPDRVLSVKSLPEKLGARSSEEKPKCTCMPRNAFPKSSYGYIGK